jgi:circadian clock protein KaiC
MGKEERPDRCVTGIDGLDNVLGGGIPTSSIILICGGTGTGKTALAVEFIARGAAGGEAGLFIGDVGDEKRLLSGLPSFTFLTPESIKKGTFSVIAPDEIFKDIGSDAVDAAVMGKMSSALDKVLSTAKVKRLAIDGVDAFVSEKAARAFVGAIRGVIQKNSCTAFIIADSGPKGSLAAAADGVIVLGDIERNGDFLRTMQVLKMRGTGHSRAKYVIDLTPCGILTTPLLKGGP